MTDATLKEIFTLVSPSSRIVCDGHELGEVSVPRTLFTGIENPMNRVQASRSPRRNPVLFFDPLMPAAETTPGAEKTDFLTTPEKDPKML